MCFIGVEVEQETSAPPPKKKSWIRPCYLNRVVHLTVTARLFRIIACASRVVCSLL